MSLAIIASRRGIRRACLLSSTIGLSTLSCPLGSALAQDPRQSVALPEIVVTATTVPTPASEIANSVTVITADEMQREQRRTVPDALSTVPGLNVVQAGGPGSQTSVFIRGTNANHVKVLIDGVDATDPSNPNQAFDFGQLLTVGVDRIEVLRGPQSGLYGADAIGGVISITTKKGEGPPKATATVEGGSFGTFNQYAGLSGSQANVNYSLNVGHFHANDIPVTPLDLLPPGRQRINDRYDNWTYAAKFGVDLSDNFSINTVARYIDSTLFFTGDDFSVFPSVPAASQTQQVDHQLFARTEAVASLFDGRFKNYFGLGYTNAWSWSQGPAVAIATTNLGERVKADWRGVALLAEGQTLVLGLEGEDFSLQTDTTLARNANKAGYVELQSQFAQRLFFVVNGRHDDNDAFGGHDTWRVAPAYIIPGTETKLKASYGTGFKAPTLNQLFVNFPAFGFFANPNLKPETSTGYDAGFEQPIAGDRFRFGATYFHNDITNLINSNDTFTTLINVDQATTYGVEAFAALTVMERLKLRGDYTYTVAKDDATGDELLRRPKNKASITANWQATDQLNLSTTVLFVGEWLDVNRSGTESGITAPGYTTVNVAANYAATDHVTVFGRVDNLLDRQYQDPTGFLKPGIGIYGGVRLIN